MSESLLPYYNRELGAIRKLAGEFAEAYPKVAARLRVTPEAVDDPYVERLLEGVAFLAARVQQRLDDELPEFSETLLEMLSPHLLAPVPSMTTLRLGPAPDAQAPLRVPRGLMLETEPVRGEPVRFQTCHDVTIWPVAVETFKLGRPADRGTGQQPRAGRARLPAHRPARDHAGCHLRQARARPAAAAPARRGRGAGAAARIAVHVDASASRWPTARPTRGPRCSTPTALQPGGFGHGGSGAALAEPRLRRLPDADRMVRLPGEVPLPRPLGPRGAHAAAGKRPARHLHLPQPRHAGTRARARPRQRRARLHAGDQPVPAIAANRSRWMARSPNGWWCPMRAAPARSRSTPSTRCARAAPTACAARCCPSTGSAATRPMPTSTDVAEANYVTFRRGATPPVTGTQTWIELRDAGFDPARPADGVLTIEASCCNRDLPALLPFGAGQPRLRVSQGGRRDRGGGLPVAAHAHAAAGAERPRRLAADLASRAQPPVGHGRGGGRGGAARDPAPARPARHRRDARGARPRWCAVDTRPGVARLPGGRAGAFARGLEVTLTFDAQTWVGRGPVSAGAGARTLPRAAGLGQCLRRARRSRCAGGRASSRAFPRAAARGRCCERRAAGRRGRSRPRTEALPPSRTSRSRPSRRPLRPARRPNRRPRPCSRRSRRSNG